MIGPKINASPVPCFCRFFLIILVLPLPYAADGQNSKPSSGALSLFTAAIYNQMTNYTRVFDPEVKKELGFCIKDSDADFDLAFNFSSDLSFLDNCAVQLTDVGRRICTAAEIKFYFSSLKDKMISLNPFLRPNKNCNSSNWVPGCEPGWACAAHDGQQVNMSNAVDMPDRTANSQPCCDGFFCPQGITCMIPCPLGAYCPRATLNKTTGMCEPYSYQIPPGKPNHTCGGADAWADVLTSSEVFCSPGSYCPTTTTIKNCSHGYYCRRGSTSQKQCFHLSNCEANTETQSLHAYGIMLIVGLSIALVIIYNCSDQVLLTRYERQAKSREAAARHARETAQARERWKSAKDVAKKRALGLQQQFSRTFTRKGGVNHPESGSSSGFLPPQAPSSAPEGKKKEQSNLTKMLQSIDDNPENSEGFNVQIGDKNIKKQAPKSKQLHTRSQIFKYAYGQLEKEKAMEEKNKNLTFSGVISMATDMEVRTRPTIEVAFKDLTITLKGKNKHLMRSVSGKILPGRISAVMGPSGAGKTTFLSALTGKITGCTMSGLILINGKEEPIQSYRKIIGFVPQDDIVHGNLTVEENLRFSARCRLSRDMPKPDRVLVVERVIDSLGLQTIRDSLVGTVEKRGISGGQRKRVNVGLEMVMEPSLLILDEPTSGLDSSSSNLLLKALRREALEGVNICMVVHQPSYTLYKMFDDLILLAKGGLTVYHGSVKKVEEYFSGLGINIPERVTPPDHLIDILEGIIKPASNVNVEQLPVRWMLHNGYAVPPDMLHYCDQIGTSLGGVNPNPSEDPQKSFAGDLWLDMKHNVEVKRDHIRYNIFGFQDLSNRETPGILRQFRYYLGRLGKQRLREARIQAADYLILLLAGFCLGTLSKVTEDTFGGYGYMYTIIGVSLLCKIAALRSFNQDKLQYLRESGSGISSLAYFLAKDFIDHFNTVVKPLVYLSMYYFLNAPRSSFQDNYAVLLCLVYCVTGMAYIFAIVLEPSPAQLWSCLLPVVLTLMAYQDNETTVQELFGDYCYPKWALEAFVTKNAEKYVGVWLITRCAALMDKGYDVGDWIMCLVKLLVAGFVCRIVAFLCLLTFGKK